MIRIDQTVLEWFAEHREPWVTTVVRVVTTLGGSALLIPLVLSVGGWWWRRRRSLRPLGLLGASYGGAFLLTHLIKALTARARPPAVLAIGHYDGQSFPSGHATQATAVALMLAVVLSSATPHRRHRVWTWVVAVATALIVGFTRLYLGAHWLTDVLAGWTLGALWALLVVAAAGRRDVTRTPSSERRGSRR